MRDWAMVQSREYCTRQQQTLEKKAQSKSHSTKGKKTKKRRRHGNDAGKRKRRRSRGRRGVHCSREEVFTAFVIRAKLSQDSRRDS